VGKQAKQQTGVKLMVNSAVSYQIHAYFLHSLFFNRRWQRYVPPKRLSIFSGLNGVLCQKI
jgi:hypothetical protein